ncbi:hypothetical protein GCM10010303_00600 [Streptomyces purpurascens]|nr:hypothetical protein GCM10010303_00600 [Streptomyces purpurascens]
MAAWVAPCPGPRVSVAAAGVDSRAVLVAAIAVTQTSVVRIGRVDMCTDLSRLVGGTSFRPALTGSPCAANNDV